jgi:N,N'-diacetyllegionaminate synthase
VNFARVLIIAEAGVNHNGDPEVAKRLVAAAAAAGADAVKFQTFCADEVASPQAARAEYQVRNSRIQGQSQLDMLRGLELGRDAHFELAACAKEQGILFLSSPFDRNSADLLDEIGVPLFKLGSGEITNIPLLRHVARKRRPVVLSTGMATLEEVAHALRILQTEGNDDIVLMHCVTQYPAPAAEVNLRAMQAMATTFHLPVGYSDHTEGNEIAFAATALGACCIEKHFTLSRTMEGPDHAASQEPHELKALVRGIRNIELAFGDGIKRPAPCEMPNRLLVRRSVFAAEEIPSGRVLTAAMLACKRPGTGIPAECFDELVGRRAVRRFRAGEMLDCGALSKDFSG